MKVLFHHLTPFALAHGGQQIQIVRTREALEQLGVEVEFLRWYDGSQTGDVLHFFGRIPTSMLALARQKGMKVVVADLLTEQGSRSRLRLGRQRRVMRVLEMVTRGRIARRFDWDSYRRADACIANTEWEGRLLRQMFRVPEEKIHVVPNGVEDVFLQSQKATRGPWLVCVGTITERKRMVELAEAAMRAQTPLWVIGKPYSDADPYAVRFGQLVKANPKVLRFEGEVADREKLARIYREARGFVLLSAMETRSLSAEEATACECPLLLSDLPWARSVFGDTVSYCPLTPAADRTAAVLHRFYDAAPNLKAPARPVTWAEVARQLRDIYRPSTSR